ncbi:MAG: YqiA/YcfP family alpha/beta fold hydrolase [Pikeienuella sp.]
MIRFVTAVLCVLFLAAGAKPQLNPEYGSPEYQAPSIFTPDRAVGRPIRDDVVVVFHGFRSAVPNGTYKRVRKLLKKSHTTIGVNYNYFDIEGTKVLLEKLAAEELAGRNVTVFGTSLGGFWADWFGRHIGADQIVMINPVPKPSEEMAKHVGITEESTRRAISLTTTAEQVAGYTALEDGGHADIPTLLILTRDDDALDYRLAEQRFAGRPGLQLVMFDEGGHTLNLKKHPARDVIQDFVQGN